MKAIKLWFIRMIDVYEEECSEVFVMWFLSFIYRVCMVLGWTVMVAFFVGEYGVLYLPVLFALHSFSNILGSLFFGRLINKFEKSSLTLYIAIITSFVFAINAFVYAVSPELFLVTSLIGVSLFLSQFKIVRALFAEGIFSPTQATRVFPVIESAETIGVLLGGTLVAVLSMTLSLNKIFLVMVVLMLLCVPTILYYMDKSILVPYRQLLSIPEKDIHIEEDDIMDWGLIKKQLKNNKFVSYLFLVVLFQFIFFGILEFHFTFVVEEFSKSYHDTGGLESNLAADLGTLHAVFAAVVLFVQLLLTSRILKNIGAISTMLISPIVMIVSTLGMIFSFGFPSVLIARFNQEVTHVLHYNAYHTSYYALSHKFRTAVIELLEGVVRPLGNIVAMIVLFSFNYFLPDQFTLYSNVFSLLILGMVIMFTLKFGKQFNIKPVQTLQMSESLIEQINAVEILESVSDKQLNLKKVKDILDHRKSLQSTVKGRLYRYIGAHGRSEDIFFLIDHYSDSECKAEILESINDLFEKYSNILKSQKFSLEYLHNFYDNLIDQNPDDSSYKELVIFLTLFYVQSGSIVSIVDMCEQILDEDNCLYFTNVLSEMNDPGLYYLFSKYLYLDSSKIRMSFLLALDTYMDAKEIKALVRSCLVSSDHDAVISGLMYIIISGSYELMEFYDGLIKERMVDSFMIRFCYLIIQKLRFDDSSFDDNLSLMNIEDVDEVLFLFKEWSVDNDILNLVLNRYEMELFRIYDKLPHENDHNAKLELLYMLKKCYKFLGANGEYFMLKDLLA